MKRLVLGCTLILTACGGNNDGTSEAAIANQAESLERAADATTDQAINRIEAESAEEMPAEASPNTAANASVAK